ncbi:cytoplasmic tRNA 2-thiolation protein 2 isoform X2 [Amia ocellicauda]|uniref:cytoplasmic tRNA 2-thiolation protein 2 isoform X2 n=1 Tax=Amia ocellicauda TaxID=2972642 RepID=UPI003464D60C
MCQVDEEYKDDQLKNRTVLSVSQKCVKCNEVSAVLIIRAGDGFCRDCFKEYFVHKFRAMLGKNRLIFPGEKVLLALSGGPASSSMLFQVQQGLSRDAPKKLRFTPGIVYIDGAATGQSPEERIGKISQLESIFSATGYPFYIVHLEEVFGLPNSVLQCVPSVPERIEGCYKAAVERFIQHSTSTQREMRCISEAEDPSLMGAQTRLSELSVQDGRVSGGRLPVTPEQTQAVERLLASVRTLTAKEELLQTLRHHLIVHTARAHGYAKVMMGDSCSRLAVKLLSNISLGRGASLAMDTGFSDPRYGDIAIVRPMREYSSKEIAFYNKMFKVPSVFIPGLDTKAPEKASIQRLTESFVNKLQAEFPSTVSTIYRTSEKLITACPRTSADKEQTEKCLLCLCTLDTSGEEASAFHATLISEKLSQKKPPELGQSPVLPGQQCCCTGGGQADICGATGGGCCSVDRTPVTHDLQSLLCYSCRLIIKDMSSVNELPQYIVSEADRRRRRAQMKEEISEFLLDPDEDCDAA